MRHAEFVPIVTYVPHQFQVPNKVNPRPHSLLFIVPKAYTSFVYLMADLEQLAAADVFVGTSSSNMGRLVFLLREGVGKERSSSISMDKAWTPKGRSRARS